MAWTGPIKTITDLTCADSPGAQPYTAPGPGGYLHEGGDSFGATYVYGANDNNAVQTKTNNIVRLGIAATGEVAIGPTAPTAGQLFAVQGSGTQSIVLLAGSGGIGIGTAAPGTSGVAIDTPAAGAVTIGGALATSVAIGGTATATIGINVANNGTINVGTAANETIAINIGDGINSLVTLSMGSATGTSTTAISAGSGGVSLSTVNNGSIDLSAAGTGALVFVGGTGTSSWQVGSGGTLNICTNNASSTIAIGSGGAGGVVNLTLGSANGASATTVTSGSTGLTLSSTGGNIAIQAGAGGNMFLSFATGAGGAGSRNISLGASASSFGGAEGALFVPNAVMNPTSNPAGGGILYSTGGAGHWLSQGGTNTTFAAADPHCTTCGADFGMMWEHEKHDEAIAVCMPCLTEEIAKMGGSTHFAHIFKRNPKLTRRDRLPKHLLVLEVSP